MELPALPVEARDRVSSSVSEIGDRVAAQVGPQLIAKTLYGSNVTRARIEISDGAVLNALHRALVEAKFHAEPNDALVAGSELVANLANQVADALEEYERARLPAGSESGAWRDPAHHPEKLEVVAARLAECERWPEWSTDQRLEYVRILLAPLRPEREVVDELVQRANTVHGAA